MSKETSPETLLDAWRRASDNAQLPRASDDQILSALNHPLAPTVKTVSPFPIQVSALMAQYRPRVTAELRPMAEAVCSVFSVPLCAKHVARFLQSDKSATYLTVLFDEEQEFWSRLWPQSVYSVSPIQVFVGDACVMALRYIVQEATSGPSIVPHSIRYAVRGTTEYRTHLFVSASKSSGLHIPFNVKSLGPVSADILNVVHNIGSEQGLLKGEVDSGSTKV